SCRLYREMIFMSTSSNVDLFNPAQNGDQYHKQGSRPSDPAARRNRSRELDRGNRDRAARSARAPPQTGNRGTDRRPVAIGIRRRIDRAVASALASCRLRRNVWRDLMFVDAAALVAILSGEPESARCTAALDDAPDPITSAIAVWEAAVALARPDKLN